MLVMLIQVFCYIYCVIVAHQLIQFELLLCIHYVVDITIGWDDIIVVSFDYDGNIVVTFYHLYLLLY